MPEVAEAIVVHVDDEEFSSVSLSHHLQFHSVEYEHVTLLSESFAYLHREEVIGFILDWRLHREALSVSGSGEDNAQNSAHLIQRLRAERPKVAVIVLTNYPEDRQLRALVRDGLLREDEVVKKSNDFQAIIERLVQRAAELQRRPWRPALRPVVGSPELDLRLLWWVERSYAGFVPPPRASSRAGELAILAHVSDLAAWNTLAGEGIRPGIAISRRDGDGWIVTGRIRIDRVETLTRLPFVHAIEGSRPLQPCLERTIARSFPPPPTPRKSAPGGHGAVIGIVDYGCDFAHPSFLHHDGSTRLLALWDQGAQPNGTSPLGLDYGVLHTAADIDSALGKARQEKITPYTALGYHPGRMAHGTHVMDIAAGGGAAPGVAPGADLIFVDLAEEIPDPTEEFFEYRFGDSVRLLEAIRFIFDAAGDRPCILNLSLGSNLGPHDGTSLVELALDDLVTENDERAVIIAAGNSGDKGLHVTGTVPQRGFSEVRWEVPATLAGPLVLEIWSGGEDRLAAELLDPTGSSLCRAELGSAWSDRKNEEDPPRLILAYRSSDTNDDNVISVLLAPGVAAGTWCLRLHGLDLDEEGGHYHAWIEPDTPRRVACFAPPHDPRCTLGSLSCGRASLVVGSYNAHADSCPCSPFSSRGPTRDGRAQPIVCAPGEKVWAADSCTSQTRPASGTSMAAPVVTGLVALLMTEARAHGRRLSGEQIRELIEASYGDTKAWNEHTGWGPINGNATLAALRPQ